MSINLRESLELTSIYDPWGRVEPEAIAAVSRILRDPGSGQVKLIQPRLVEVLSMAYEHFGKRQLVLVSGFRAPRGSLNYHSRGAAADVKIAGVPAPRLRDYFRSIDSGGMGIGIYPGSGFVHVDVRPPPSYYWVDAGPARRPAKRRRPARKPLMPELAGAQ
jgi:uncharacterized protein YcbK (DUF882 family)